MEDTTPEVAVLGPLGTYTHEAAYTAFGPHVRYQEQQTITDVFKAITSLAPIAVVPRENSIFGSVIETYDNLRSCPYGFAKGEVTLKVHHCLVARKGVSLDNIQRVMSHEQALGQCQAFLKEHLPNAIQVKMPSTASAARALLDEPLDCAAICSKMCAGLFESLNVLREGIQTCNANYTRFLILTRNRDDVMPIPVLSRCRALFRVHTGGSVGSNARVNDFNLMDILRLFETRMGIARIDRRPNLEAAPFHDVYFLEVKQLEQRSASRPDTSDSWAAEVDRTAHSVRQAGYNAEVIGIW